MGRCMWLIGIMCRKNGVCVGRCMCPRNHEKKKVNFPRKKS